MTGGKCLVAQTSDASKKMLMCAFPRIPIGSMVSILLGIMFFASSIIQASTDDALRRSFLNAEDIEFLTALPMKELIHLDALCELPILSGGSYRKDLIDTLASVNKTSPGDAHGHFPLRLLKWALTELRFGQQRAEKILGKSIAASLSSSATIDAGLDGHRESGLELARKSWWEQQNGCMDMCNVASSGQPGRFFDQHAKRLNCTWLWSEDMSPRSLDDPAPTWEEVPWLLRYEFLYGGRVGFDEWFEH